MRSALLSLLLACSSASEPQSEPAEAPTSNEPEAPPEAPSETAESAEAPVAVAAPSAGTVPAEGEVASNAALECDDDAPDGLLALARAAEASRFVGELEGPLELYAAMFDTRPPIERVIRARIMTRSENPMEPVTQTDHLIAFECVNREWRMVASRAFDATPEEDDDECRRGISRVDMQRIDGIDQLIVTSQDCQLRVDPRYTQETMTILALRERALVSVFDCDFLHSAASGPCRSGVQVARQIQPYDTEKAVRVRTTRTFNRGTCNEDGELGGPAEASGEYRWDGQRFAPVGTDVCR
ncbi:MAG: hypothetical protein AAF411_11570 [Myxococcota bacterium]